MGGARSFVLVAVVAGALGASVGCTRTFHGAVVQPNPLVNPTETLRESEEVVIVTGDMELNLPKSNTARRAAPVSYQRYPLQNIASFTMVSRDRLRFHVQLEHKWQEWADPSTWDIELIDDKGRHWEPESTEHVRTKHLVTMWDQEIRSVQRNMYGDIVAINDDGWRRRVPLGSLSVFRGKADFVFYQRDLFHADVKWIKLIVKRSGMAFEFRWDFDDGAVAQRDSE